MATVKVDFIDKDSGRRYSAGMPYDGGRDQELADKGFVVFDEPKIESTPGHGVDRKHGAKRKRARS